MKRRCFSANNNDSSHESGTKAEATSPKITVINKSCGAGSLQSSPTPSALLPSRPPRTMPAPAVAVYVLAAVGTVAAGLAFKEFVYEPHIAPKIEKWAENFVARRRARKMKRSQAAVAVSVDLPGGGGAGEGGEGGYADDKRSGAEGSAYEMEDLVGEEVRQWRSQVHESIALGRDGGVGAGLRQRRRNTVRSAGGVSALDESNILIPYDTLTPTHVLFDPTEDALTASSPSPSPTSSTSTLSSRAPTPAQRVAPQQSLPMPAAHAPLTPDPSMRALSPPVSFSLSRSPSSHVKDAPPISSSNPCLPSNPFLSFTTTTAAAPLPSQSYPSPHAVPSLSLAHPAAADAALDMEVELVEAPAMSDFGAGSGSSGRMSDFGAVSEVGYTSGGGMGTGGGRSSRPESPFSEFSVGGSSTVSSSAASSGVGSGSGAEGEQEREQFYSFTMSPPQRQSRDAVGVSRSSLGGDGGSLPAFSPRADASSLTFPPRADNTSLTFSPPGMEFAVLSASSSEVGDEEGWSHAGSEVSGSSWESAGRFLSSPPPNASPMPPRVAVAGGERYSSGLRTAYAYAHDGTDLRCGGAHASSSPDASLRFDAEDGCEPLGLSSAIEYAGPVAEVCPPSMRRPRRWPLLAVALLVLSPLF
ncbi:hypothetical protein R3P38DRAFT_3415114 [Favolaschia claudopus]|uniref:Proteophosphoglycan ppg4 n=1 Tax=Favolaschia claudopus TaxID=2862362 RepID=A0AAW0ECE8_9AGAR